MAKVTKSKYLVLSGFTAPTDVIGGKEDKFFPTGSTALLPKPYGDSLAADFILEPVAKGARKSEAQKATEAAAENAKAEAQKAVDEAEAQVKATSEKGSDDDKKAAQALLDEANASLAALEG